MVQHALRRVASSKDFSALKNPKTHPPPGANRAPFLMENPRRRISVPRSNDTKRATIRAPAPPVTLRGQSETKQQENRAALKENQMKRIIAIMVAATCSAGAFPQVFSEIYPDTIAVNAGAVVGGDIHSIYTSDGNFLVMAPKGDSNQVQVEMLGHAPYGFNGQMQFVLESAVLKAFDDGRPVYQVVEMLNYRDKIYTDMVVDPWNIVDVRKLGRADQMTLITVPTKIFVDAATRETMVRITWFNPNDDLAWEYRVGIDWACWKFPVK